MSSPESFANDEHDQYSFDLPIGWTQIQLGEILVKLTNGLTKRQNKDGVGVPVSRIETISGGQIDMSRVGFVPGLDEAAIEKYRLRKGDILLSHINSDLHLGKSALFDLENVTLLHGMNLLLVRVDRAVILPRFLHYLFNYLRFSGYFMSIAQHAVNQSSLNQSRMKLVPVPLPPIPEQHRIVAEIETQFTRLDAGVAALKRVQANLRRYKASVLKAACEGRLVPTEAELARVGAGSPRPYEPAGVLLERILAERRAKWEAENPGKKYKEPAAPATVDLLELPEGWVWASIDQYVVNHDAKRVPVKAADRQNMQGDYPYYGASGIIDHVDGYLFDGDYLLIAEDGANLLARSSPIAFQANGRFWVNNHAHVVQTHLDCPLGYVEYYFNSIDLTFHVTGTAQPKLTQANLNRIPVPVPPNGEQHRIVAEVERRLSVIQELEATVEANLKRAERLRQSILKRAFEGRLVSQDPNDEPASGLLERMRSRQGQTTVHSHRSSGSKAKNKQLPLL